MHYFRVLEKFVMMNLAKIVCVAYDMVRWASFDRLRMSGVVVGR